MYHGITVLGLGATGFPLLEITMETLPVRVPNHASRRHDPAAHGQSRKRQHHWFPQEETDKEMVLSPGASHATAHDLAPMATA